MKSEITAVITQKKKEGYNEFITIAFKHNDHRQLCERLFR